MSFLLVSPPDTFISFGSQHRSEEWVMVDLNGRVALVTGGGKGIGRGISSALAAAGAAVAVNYATDRAAAERTVADIVGSGGRAVAVAGDVGNPDDVERLFERANGALGPVDTLVNNAAI